MQKKQLSISNTILLNMVLVVSAAILLTGYLWLRHEFGRHQKEKAKLKADYMETQQTLLKWEVQQAMDFIRYKKAQTEDRLKTDIKNRVYEADAIATHLYNKYKSSLPGGMIKALIHDALRPIRFNHGRGYYFATEMNGVSWLFADHPELEGKNIKGMIDPNGKEVVLGLIRIAREKGEGFYQYQWTKPHVTGKNYPKIAYVKYFPPLDCYIGTGEYLDDVEKDIRQEVLARIEKIRFGRAGYIFVGTWDGISLTVPQKGKNMNEVTDVNGVKIVQELIRLAKSGGGFLTYVIPKFESSGRSAPKMSYVEGIGEWQWYVGAGRFMDEIETVLHQKEQHLNEVVRRQITNILLILIGCLGIVLLVVRIISRRIKNNLNSFTDFFARASSDLVKVDMNQLNFPEFSDLARSVNYMVDARQAAETELCNRELQQRAIFDAAKNIAFVIAGEHVDGPRIKEFSSGAERIFGYHRNEIIGKPAAILTLPEYSRKFSEYRKKMLKGEPGFVGEATMVRKNGQPFPALFSLYPLIDHLGNMYAALGVTIDISEQKRMMADQMRLETAVEQAAELIMITDKQGLIQYVNPAFEKATGYLRKEVIGQNPRFLQSGKQDKLFYETLWATISNGQIWKGHFVNRKKDGTLYEEDATITPIRDEAGAIVNYVSVKRDVTKELQLERQLFQTQKMEAIGTLAGGIAHDFNNILAAIIGYTELMLQDVSRQPPMHNRLQKILQAGYRARDLVQQILTFSRQSEMEPKPVRLNIIIKEALKFLRASLPATITLKQDVSSDATVIADPTQIHQIIMNLCTNAAHAMKQDGGTLSVVLSEVHADSQLTSWHTELVAGPLVRLSVSDTGQGIAPDVLDRVFDPFFTTKGVHEGSGMGLSVVHGIVKRMGGTVTIDSHPGEGTCVEIFLPLIPPQAPDRPAELSALPMGTERILLIDDEEFQADIGKQALERLGYRVTVRMNPIEALELFQAKPDQFDLVLTDMTMPQMTGDQLSRKMIDIRPDIPIILCTGYSEHISEKKAESIGIKGFAYKPVVMEKLANMVRRALNHTN